MARSIDPGTGTTCLTVGISRDGFKQEYKLLFTKNGTEEVSDQDAIKIGEGYVSIAGLVNNTKLAIDRRPLLLGDKEVKLYVNGWATGNYTLHIEGKETFDKLTDITLIDAYTNQRVPINTMQKTYHFYIDINDPGSRGANRFSLAFEQKKDLQNLHSGSSAIIYPNPFSDKLRIKTLNNEHMLAVAIIRNLLGSIVSTQQINLYAGNDTEIAVGNLIAGMYFVQLVDKSSNKTIATFKISKK